MGVGIEVRGLNAWYGKNLALKSIDMTVSANHVTAVIGPSGCGKSTFVRCLNRMHETIPDARAEGEVKVGDIEVYGDGTDPVEVRRRIGMVFQKPNPFPTMSIYDNVAAGLRLNGFRNRKQLDELVERWIPSRMHDEPLRVKVSKLREQTRQAFDRLFGERRALAGAWLGRRAGCPSQGGACPMEASRTRIPKHFSTVSDPGSSTLWPK